MPSRTHEDKSSELRKRAEKVLAGKEMGAEQTRHEDLQVLIAELSIYQTELEIQNENLRETQRHLEESRLKYSDLYDFAPIGYFTFDKTGLILEVNLTGASLLGVERRYLKRHVFAHYVQPEFRPVYRAHLDEVVKTRQKSDCELIMNKGGEPFFARMESIARFDEEAGQWLIRSAVTDISDRKRIERELEGAYATLEEKVQERTGELREANRELEAFTYSVSHDLRSPLRAIQGFTRMIVKEYEKELEGELLRKFRIIEENAVKMGKLIDSLLDFSRLGRKDIHFARVDMEHITGDVIKDLEQADNTDRLKIDLQKLPTACGDPQLIRQVVYNLLSNAIKFTRKRTKPLIKIGGKRDGDFSLYFVKDNGAGFNMDYYGKLFGVFQRLHGAEYGGTGIGLAIVRRIVEKHGGKIWGEGAENKGATFYFTLPNEMDRCPKKN